MNETDDDPSPFILGAGKYERFYCSICLTEFEVLHEPKAKDQPYSAGDSPAKELKYCPFCGERGPEVA